MKENIQKASRNIIVVKFNAKFILNDNGLNYVDL